jgi:transposase-like protein
MAKIPPSRRIKQEIDAFFMEAEGENHPLGNFVRMGARYMLQVALEQEIEDFLGRSYCERGAGKGKGWRNGYEPGKVKTADGILEVALPQVRGNSNPFCSRIAPALKGNSNLLGRLVTGMYVRGLSTRDIEDMLTEALGEDVISRSGVSRLTFHLQKGFDEWRKRDLSDIKVTCLFLDAVYLPVPQGVGRE